MNVKGTTKKNQVTTANIFEQQELLKKAEVLSEVWKPSYNKSRFEMTCATARERKILRKCRLAGKTWIAARWSGERNGAASQCWK